MFSSNTDACVTCVTGKYADAPFTHCKDVMCKMQVAAQEFLKHPDARTDCQATCVKVKEFLPAEAAVNKLFCGYCKNGFSPDNVALKSRGCNSTKTTMMGSKLMNYGRAAGCVGFIKGLMDRRGSMCGGCANVTSGEIDPIAIHWAILDEQYRNKSYISFL